LNDNFWIAFDSLDPKNTHILQKGINFAKEMQQAIIRVGGSIIDRKEVKMAQHFRYVTIENDQL
jgi:trehalose-6-phosphatase